MIYAYPNQLSAVAPFSLGSGGSQINGVSNDYVEVQSNGKLSNIVPVQHQRSSPGLFALDGSGTGQAAALNQDFTINSSGNPAARGSVVQLFATGFGQTNPPLTDGQINPSTAPLPAISPPLVSIGGTSAQVVFAGAAPEAVAGLYQINAVVPNSIQPGDAIPLRITFGDVSNTVTIAVK
jgi:uncharacterized protein (TIGR03437 family)